MSEGRSRKSMAPGVYVAAARSQRTPPGTEKVDGKFCSVHHANAQTAGDAKAATQATWESLRLVYPGLKVGDPICDVCAEKGRYVNSRARATTGEDGSGGVARERRVSGGGVVDLELDVMQETAARATQRRKTDWSPDVFDEFDDAHPWQGQCVSEVPLDADLVAGLASLTAHQRRLALHGVGMLIQRDREAVAAEKQVDEQDMRAAAYEAVAKEFASLLKSIPSGVEALTSAPWAAVRVQFASEACRNLRNLVDGLVATQGDGRSTGRQSREHKLFKAIEPLMLLGKIRSERCSGLALVRSVYLYSLGVTETPMAVMQQIGLTVDPDTRRRYEQEWVEKYHRTSLDAVLKGDFQLVIDNFQMFYGVRDVGAGAMSNTFIGTGGYVRLRQVAPEGLSAAGPAVPEVLVLNERGLQEVAAVLGRVISGIFKTFQVKVSGEPGCGIERVVDAVVTCRVSLPILDCNIGTHPGTLAALYRYSDLCKMEREARVWPVLGDAATVRNIHRVRGVLEADHKKGVQLETLPGLFHMQMCGPMAILWKLHFDEIKAAATVLNAEARIKAKVHANYSTHNRVCLFAAQAHTLAAWDAYTNEVGDAERTALAFARWIVKDGLAVSTNVSRKWRRFLCFLLVNAAWDEAIKVENGETILLLMRFLVPYLAAISSSFYFDIVARFAGRVLAQSPRERFLTLQSLFVNPTGKKSGGIAADMALERDFGDLKHLVRAPRPDALFLAKISERLPLYQQVREIVEESIRPAKVGVTRTTRDLTVQVLRLRSRHVVDYGSIEPLAPPRHKGKKGAEKVSPLERQHAKFDRAYSKCRKKLRKDTAVATDDVEDADGDAEEFFWRGQGREDDEDEVVHFGQRQE